MNTSRLWRARPARGTAAAGGPTAAGGAAAGAAVVRVVPPMQSRAAAACLVAGSDWHDEAGTIADADLPIPTERAPFGEFRRATNTYLNSSDAHYEGVGGYGVDGPSQPHARTEIGDSVPPLIKMFGMFTV